MLSKYFKHGLALILCLSLVLGAFSPAFAEEAEPEWTVSKSKTASEYELDPTQTQTEVTLSLPSGEYKNVVDVVFVMDNSTSIENAGLDLSTEVRDLLDGIVEKNPGIELKVSVVKFRGYATDMLGNKGLVIYDNESKTDILNAISNTSVPGSGSNIHSGLMMANELLSEDDEVPNDNKYVVLLSDGKSYIWNNEDGEPVQRYSQYLSKASLKYEGKPTVNQIAGNYNKEQNAALYLTVPGINRTAFYFNSNPTDDEKSSAYYTELYNRTDDELVKSSVYDFPSYYSKYYEYEGENTADGTVNKTNRSDIVNAAEVFNNSTNYLNMYGNHYDFIPEEGSVYEGMRYLSINPYNLGTDDDGNIIFDTSNPNEDFFLWHADTMQKGLYTAGHYWKETIVENYNAAAILKYAGGGGGHHIVGSFICWMLENSDYGARVDDANGILAMFDGIDNNIRYLCDHGIVTDPIASELDLVIEEGVCPFTLTVGGELFEAVQGSAANTWDYNSEGKTLYCVTWDEDEKVITWDINVPVENANPVQLSYTLEWNGSGERDTDTPTNGTTTLEYWKSTNTGNTPNGIEEFEVPEVIYNDARVSYDPNGGEGEIEDENNPYKVGTEIDLKDADGFSFEGHYFVEWNTDPDGDGESYDEGDAYTLEEDTTFYAIWDKLYTLVYEWDGDVPEGEELPEDDNQYEGSEAALEAADENEYAGGRTLTLEDGYTYTFGGWEDYDVDEEEAVVTVYGEWTKEKDPEQWYTVAYEWDGDVPETDEVELPEDDEEYLGAEEAFAAVNEKQYPADYTVTLDDGYTYTFSGWDDGTLDEQDRVVTFKGTWTKEKDPEQWYTVVYEWDGDVPADAELPVDEEEYLGPDAAKEAVDTTYTGETEVTDEAGFIHSFSGWDAGTVNQNERTVTFYGEWTSEKDPGQWYSVVYEWENAPESETLPVDENEYLGLKEAKAAVDTTYTAETVVTDDEDATYTFSGWDEGTVEGQVVTFRGEWTVEEAEKFTVVYEWTGAEKLTEELPVDQNEYDSEEEARAAVDTTFTSKTKAKGTDKRDYTFSGWDEGTLEGSVITFAGKWTKKSNEGSGGVDVTLTYESNGGTKFAKEGYAKNTVVQLTKVPKKEGYTFTGWHSDPELTDKIDEIKMTSDKTVYAGWKKTDVPPWLNGDDHFAYIVGYVDETVKPDANITRAEVATVFFRLLKGDVRDENLTYENSFNDVEEGMWFNTAISTLEKLGIVNGYADGGFHPNDPITRAEFTKMAAMFDDRDAGIDADFSDISEHWASDEISKAAENGWVDGYEDGSFLPDAKIKRCEAMAIINRVLGRLPQSKDDLLPGMVEWPDNMNESKWFYLHVQEATNSHECGHREDGTEFWTELTEIPDWTRYER